MDNNTLEITSSRYSLDWFDHTKHNIDLNKVHSFEIHHRGDWHVVVVYKPTQNNNDFYRDELGHWVSKVEVVKLIKDQRTTISKIVNYHNSTDFIQKIQSLFTS